MHHSDIKEPFGGLFRRVLRYVYVMLLKHYAIAATAFEIRLTFLEAVLA